MSDERKLDISIQSRKGENTGGPFIIFEEKPGRALKLTSKQVHALGRRGLGGEGVQLSGRSRGVGKTTISRLLAKAVQENSSLLDGKTGVEAYDELARIAKEMRIFDESTLRNAGKALRRYAQSKQRN